MLPDTSNRTIAKKVVFDQLVFAPAFYLSFYFGMSLLEGHTVTHSVEHIKKKFVPTYLAVCARGERQKRGKKREEDIEKRGRR